eukprot:NODE_35_length_36362_cov_0.944434.p26 type:complete len:164 gc:universal NODE_35_length_36362_cov_0.944434:4339-4830(+)
MTDGRSKEPKCCCCGVRIGLGILFVLSLIFGILGLVGRNYGQGACMVVGGLVGLFAVVKKSVKAATFTLYFFILTQLISVAFGIYYITTIGSAVDAAIDDAKKNNDNTDLSPDQIESLRGATKSYYYAIYIIGLVISVIITILVSERMIAFRKWLKTKRSTYT